MQLFSAWLRADGGKSRLFEEHDDGSISGDPFIPGRGAALSLL